MSIKGIYKTASDAEALSALRQNQKRAEMAFRRQIGLATAECA